MRFPEKRVSISQCLRDRIAQRYYQPGEQLPHEEELAVEFAVSRKTLRAALEPLEEGGLLQRIRGKGTFVSERHTPIITMLMPCENFMLEDSYSACRLRGQFTGAMRAAREFGCRLETVAVSPTNNRDDILPDCFDGISAESMVIVPGCWFEPVFPLLAHRQARVCLMDSQLLRPAMFPETADWFQVQENQISAYEQSVCRLYDRGCRRIAMVVEFIRRPGYPKLEGYLRAIRRLGLPDLSFQHAESMVNDLRPNLRQLYDTEKFDGLIIACPECIIDGKETLSAWLGLPEELPVLATHLRQTYCALGQLPDHFCFDEVAQGWEAVRLLVQPSQEHRIYSQAATFHMHSTEKSMTYVTGQYA